LRKLSSVHGKSKIAETEKFETGEEQSQEHAHNFFYIKGIAHKEFVLAGQTVSSVYHCDILWWLHETKTSPRILVTKELAVASRQFTISHFLFHLGIFDPKQHDCHPPPTQLFSLLN
jgi:hypothetical protein